MKEKKTKRKTTDGSRIKGEYLWMTEEQAEIQKRKDSDTAIDRLFGAIIKGRNNSADE